MKTRLTRVEKEIPCVRTWPFNSLSITECSNSNFISPRIDITHPWALHGRFSLRLACVSDHGTEFSSSFRVIHPLSFLNDEESVTGYSTSDGHSLMVCKKKTRTHVLVWEMRIENLAKENRDYRQKKEKKKEKKVKIIWETSVRRWEITW